MGITDRIKKLGNYFKEMQIVTIDGKLVIYVIVKFPYGWVIDEEIEEKFNVTVSTGEYSEEFYFCSEIDKALAFKMKSNGTEHFTACVIEGIDKPLAILLVSFDKLPNEHHDCQTNRENIRHIAMELSVIFEVEARLAEQTNKVSFFKR